MLEGQGITKKHIDPDYPLVLFCGYVEDRALEDASNCYARANRKMESHAFEYESRISVHEGYERLFNYVITFISTTCEYWLHSQA